MVTTNVAWVTDVTNDNSGGLPGLGVTGKPPLPQPASQCDVHCGGGGGRSAASGRRHPTAPVYVSMAEDVEQVIGRMKKEICQYRCEP